MLASTSNASPKLTEISPKEIEEKMDTLIAGSLPYYKSIFKDMFLANQHNGVLLFKFLITEQNEQNIKLSTKTSYIKIIYPFNRFLNFKDFEEITKQEIIDYLSLLRKPESIDPTHKWIGTFNTRQKTLSKFFKWIYNRDEHDKENWITPDCIDGIKPLPRKEKSPYKPDDIWTDNEHALFLKYCPEKRDRYYHAMANDTSARPHELLSLRLGDVKFKISSSTGKQYAEVHIVDSKTKPRTLPLIFSLPYIKEWIESHPFANNPNSWLFISLSDGSYGKQLTENALYKIYARTYKQKYFPRLLADTGIDEVDKSFLRNLVTKPWAPYIQRHSALTKKSLILKESSLRDHAGWSMTSRMPNVYIHYFGNESSKSLLEAYGIEDFSKKQMDILKNKICPNCTEPNKQDSKFCMKCRMVLTYDSYSQTIEEQKKKENEIQKLKKEQEIILRSVKEMENKFQQYLRRLMWTI